MPSANLETSCYKNCPGYYISYWGLSGHQHASCYMDHDRCIDSRVLLWHTPPRTNPLWLQNFLEWAVEMLTGTG